MVFEATTANGKVAMKVDDPPTAEDLRRLSHLCALIPDANWTGKPGEDVR